MQTDGLIRKPAGAFHEPYVGPRPFDTDDAGVFFGRDQETADLVSLVTARRLVVVFGDSGVGKTSLLHAGLVPAMQQAGCSILATVRFGRASIGSTGGVNPYVCAAVEFWTGSTIDAAIAPQISLPSCLRDRFRETPPRTSSAPMLAIFDQLEDLATLPGSSERQRHDLFVQIGEALEQCPGLMVVLVTRSESLSDLNRFSAGLPGGLRCRFRLERLQRESAAKAIYLPAQIANKTLQPGTAEHVAQIVAADGRDSGDLGKSLEFVDPFILQLACLELWRGLMHDEGHAGVDSAARIGAPETLPFRFYERAIKAGVAALEVTEGELRRWFNTLLLPPEQGGGAMVRGADETGGLPNATLDRLVNARVLGKDTCRPEPSYALAHDRLGEAIRASNAQWLLRHSAADSTRADLEARADEWIRRGRSTDALMNASDALAAQRWIASAGAHEVGYNRAASEYVAASVQNPSTTDLSVSAAPIGTQRNQLILPQPAPRPPIRTTRQPARISTAALVGAFIALFALAAVGLESWTLGSAPRRGISTRLANGRSAGNAGAITRGAERARLAAAENALRAEQTQRLAALQAAQQRGRETARLAAEREAAMRRQSELASLEVSHLKQQLAMERLERQQAVAMRRRSEQASIRGSGLRLPVELDMLQRRREAAARRERERHARQASSGPGIQVSEISGRQSHLTGAAEVEGLAGSAGSQPGGRSLRTAAGPGAAASTNSIEVAGNLLAAGDRRERRGKYLTAIENYQRALDSARARGDRAGEARALTHIAQVYADNNWTGDAARMYRDVLTIQLELGDKSGQASILTKLANVYHRSDMESDAAACRREAQALRAGTAAN